MMARALFCDVSNPLYLNTYSSEPSSADEISFCNDLYAFLVLNRNAELVKAHPSKLKIIKPSTQVSTCLGFSISLSNSLKKSLHLSQPFQSLYINTRSCALRRISLQQKSPDCAAWELGESSALSFP